MQQFGFYLYLAINNILQFSPFSDRLGHRGDMKDDPAEVLFQSFLPEVVVSSSGTGRDVHSLTLSIQHFPLLTMASTCVQGGVEDGFGEAVVAACHARTTQVSVS